MKRQVQQPLVVLSWQAIGATALALSLSFILVWKPLVRLFKRREWYGKQKTIIKYMSDVNGLLRLKDASGLGLHVVHFAVDDCPGICCSSCGPIFYFNLQEKDDDIICKCSFCLLELSPQEKSHIKSFIDELFLPANLKSSLVMCSNNVHGCDILLPLKELNGHVQRCPYTTLPCPHACGIAVERQRMEDHIKLCKKQDIAVPNRNPPSSAPPLFLDPCPPSPPPSYKTSIYEHH